MFPEPTEQHAMVLEQTHPSGADEFYCPTCGRRILIQWPPVYKKTVLEEGDLFAAHSADKGGLGMGAPGASGLATSRDQAQEGDDLPLDHPSLDPWADWADHFDFGNDF